MTLTVESVPVISLKPHPRNPRQGDVGAIAESLKAHGQYRPIVAQRSTSYILAGNHTWKAAKALKWKDIATVFVDVSDDEAYRILLVDNRSGDLADYDNNELTTLLQELTQTELGLEGTGYDGDALDELLRDLGMDEDKPDPAPQMDRAAELREQWGTERGQIWAIPSKSVPGKSHRLMCGDSTSAEDVARLMGGEKVGLCFTSPPYAQQREYGDAELVQDWDALMSGVFANTPMVDDGQVLVNLGLIHKDGEAWQYWDAWLRWMRSAGWRCFGWYVWDKISATFKANDGRLWVSHEWVFHFNRKPVPCIEWQECKHAGEERNVWGQRKPDGHVAKLSTPGKIKTHRPPDSVIRVQRETNNADPNVRRHPARFPVALPEYVIRSFPGDVYEPFMGSGTTMVAAENERRVCYGMEIDPGYCAVILQRMTDMGLAPHRVTRDEDNG